MAQFISKEPIVFKILPDNTLSCPFCDHKATYFVSIRNCDGGMTQVKVPMCDICASACEVAPFLLFSDWNAKGHDDRL